MEEGYKDAYLYHVLEFTIEWQFDHLVVVAIQVKYFFSVLSNKIRNCNSCGFSLAILILRVDCLLDLLKRIQLASVRFLKGFWTRELISNALHQVDWENVVAEQHSCDLRFATHKEWLLIHTVFLLQTLVSLSDFILGFTLPNDLKCFLTLNLRIIFQQSQCNSLCNFNKF